MNENATVTATVGRGRYHAPGCRHAKKNAGTIRIRIAQVRRWWMLDLVCHRCFHTLMKGKAIK